MSARTAGWVYVYVTVDGIEKFKSFFPDGEKSAMAWVERQEDPTIYRVSDTKPPLEAA